MTPRSRRATGLVTPPEDSDTLPPLAINIIWQLIPFPLPGLAPEPRGATFVSFAVASPNAPQSESASAAPSTAAELGRDETLTRAGAMVRLQRKHEAGGVLRCWGCGEVDTRQHHHSRCDRCKTAVCCTESCQLAHWPTHRRENCILLDSAEPGILLVCNEDNTTVFSSPESSETVGILNKGDEVRVVGETVEVDG